MIDSIKRAIVCARADSLCEVCGVPRPLLGPWGVRGEVAHRVAKGKSKKSWTLRKYGEEALDHLANLAWTCPGKCNSAVLITYKPVQREALMCAIAEKLRAKIEEGKQ